MHFVLNQWRNDNNAENKLSFLRSTWLVVCGSPVDLISTDACMYF